MEESRVSSQTQLAGGGDGGGDPVTLPRGGGILPHTRRERTGEWRRRGQGGQSFPPPTPTKGCVRGLQVLTFTPVGGCLCTTNCRSGSPHLIKALGEGGLELTPGLVLAGDERGFPFAAPPLNSPSRVHPD